MVDAWLSWEGTSQAVSAIGALAGAVGVWRYVNDREAIRSEPVEDLDWDGDGVADEDEPLRHWCQGCDRLPLLMEMRWCDYGARWLCHRCAVAYPSGLAEAVVAKARTDATARLQELLYQVAATAVEDDATSLAKVVPLFAAVPGKLADSVPPGRCDCGECQRGVHQEVHTTFDASGRVVRIDCDCPPNPMGFDCEHDS